MSNLQTRTSVTSNEYVSPVLCVCVCVGEREREREGKKYHIRRKVKV